MKFKRCSHSWVLTSWGQSVPRNVWYGKSYVSVFCSSCLKTKSHSVEGKLNDKVVATYVAALNQKEKK